jgi:hypothetical protein
LEHTQIFHLSLDRAEQLGGNENTLGDKVKIRTAELINKR